MTNEQYFYNCSKEYVDLIDPYIPSADRIINGLPKSKTQSAIIAGKPGRFFKGTIGIFARKKGSNTAYLLHFEP
ncbi:MAG TPA: hypothetical protein DEF36_17140 [Desulfotomaculum sp.]|nr:hypothetical protein [Desulfotomaculum sp.]